MGRKRIEQMEKRVGRQRAPAEFIEGFEQVHRQRTYAPITMTEVTIPTDMRERMEKAARERKPNTAVRNDGVHIEML